MGEITVHVAPDGYVAHKVLSDKLQLLKRRGLMDAGLVLVADGMLRGYLAEGELDFGINELGPILGQTGDSRVALLQEAVDGELDLSSFVDRTPLTLCASAPVEYAVEMFGKLGLRYLCVVDEVSGKLVGVSSTTFHPVFFFSRKVLTDGLQVIIKKRLVGWLEGQH